MVEVVLGSPCHASSHDRPPGHLGSPLAPGGTCPGPDHCGLSAAHGDLHPDGCSSRGYNSAHQTGEWGCVGNGTDQGVNKSYRRHLHLKKKSGHTDVGVYLKFIEG